MSNSIFRNLHKSLQFPNEAMKLKNKKTFTNKSDSQDGMILIKHYHFTIVNEQFRLLIFIKSFAGAHACFAIIILFKNMFYQRINVNTTGKLMTNGRARNIAFDRLHRTISTKLLIMGTPKI